MRTIDELVQDHIGRLESYVPGIQPDEGGWIKLNTNELPYPPPPQVIEAIIREASSLARYPNPSSQQLRRALAGLYGLQEDQVIAGNGSDDLLNLLARAFGGPGRQTLETFPSYSLYPVLTAMAGGKITSIPFDPEFHLPVDKLAQSSAELLFLTSPNAPTGVSFNNAQLRELAERFDGILVIDEAYAEFAEETAIPLLRDFEHIIVTRTFSKAYGLAGLRVGYAMADPRIIDILDRVRDSYNVNRLSQAGAIAAISAQDHYRKIVREIKSTRDRTSLALRDLGWQVYPSQANFLFARPLDSRMQTGAHVASSLYQHLLGRKILVRYFPMHPLTDSCLRISIGLPSEMERFIEEVTKWQKSG